jgi:hypothetical protein
VDGGFEPVSIEVDGGDGLVRFAVGSTRTGPDAAELRAIATMCREAADFVEAEIE